MSGLLGPIRVKRSTVSGEVPAAGDLVDGEIASNTADAKLFVKHNDGTVKEISGSSAIDDLTDVDTSTVAPTDGQALIWDNTAGQWGPGTVSSGGLTVIDNLADVDTSTVAPTDGQALIWDNANSKWKPGTVSGSGATRLSIVTTTSSLADQAAEDVVFTAAGKSGMFLTIETDRAARVVCYTSTAARTADSSRSSNIQPESGSGVLLEVITQGAETITISPSVNYFNVDTVVSSDLIAMIENRSGSSSTVEVTLQVLSLEP